MADQRLSAAYELLDVAVEAIAKARAVLIELGIEDQDDDDLPELPIE